MKLDKRGRPKTVGKTGAPRKVSLVFSPQQYKLLESRVRHENVSMSEYLRRAVDNYI